MINEIIMAGIGIVTFFILRKEIRKFKKGACGCGCSGCSGCSDVGSGCSFEKRSFEKKKR